jgi:hypothetical protein
MKCHYFSPQRHEASFRHGIVVIGNVSAIFVPSGRSVLLPHELIHAALGETQPRHPGRDSHNTDRDGVLTGMWRIPGFRRDFRCRPSI